MPVTINGTTGVDTPGVVSSGAVSGTTGTFSGNVTANGLATELRPLVLMTAQNTTSGSSVDFIGIPSWAKRVTVMFNGVSTNGVNHIIIQFGTSGGLQTTGYFSYSVYIQGGSVGALQSTAGTAIVGSSAASVQYGPVSFTNFGGNTWMTSGVMSTDTSTTDYTQMLGGSFTLSGVLDRIRITTNSADTFDAGSINVMYE